MRTLSTYINEAIKIGKSADNISVYTCQPKTKEELEDIIEERIKSEGPNCDLNDIDVSEITDMSLVFFAFSKFNGDISKWDVSNVKNMNYMFRESNFNNDISKWDVRNVESMKGMFYESSFNKDISEWNVSNVKDMMYMFYCSKFNHDISKWDVSNVKNMEGMFEESTFNGNISNWKINKDCGIGHMFVNCPIKEEFKPKLPRKK